VDICFLPEELGNGSHCQAEFGAHLLLDPE
jgi:hypothetical protein